MSVQIIRQDQSRMIANSLKFWWFSQSWDPFWRLMIESDTSAKENPVSVRQLENGMIPSKLTCRKAVG